jgi:hypothetical protein
VTRRPIGQALPRVKRALEGFQADLRRNLACVGAAELCPADPAYTDELR